MTAAAAMEWWEREKLLTKKDKEVIDKARTLSWEEILATNLEDEAETEFGRYEVHSITLRKFHYDEYQSGML